MCFLGIFGDQRGQNLNIFLKSREENGQKSGRLACFHRVHWLQVVGLFGVSGPAKRLALVLWSCVPSFCPLSRFVFGVSRANMVLFRVLRAFLARFGVVVWVCVACVLCVACVALCACGVRRIYGLLRVCLHFIRFSLFVLVFVLLSLSLCACFALLVLLSCLVCSCGLCCCFFFPFGLYAKRKGAKGCPCVLACLVVGCFIWLLLCIPRTRQVSARLYRNKVLEKGNLIECSKLFCARLCSYLCSSKFVFLLFSFLFLLVGSYFLSPFGAISCVLSWCVVGLFICLVPL